MSVPLSPFNQPTSQTALGWRVLNKSIMTPSLSTRAACRSLYAIVTVGSFEASCLTDDAEDCSVFVEAVAGRAKNSSMFSR